MCSKQFWKQHESFLPTQNMIMMMNTVTLLQLMGIIPTKGTCRKCNDSLGEKNFKYKQPYVLDWFSHCASKTYIRQTTVLKNLNLIFKRVIMLVYSLSERKTTY